MTGPKGGIVLVRYCTVQTPLSGGVREAECKSRAEERWSQ
nr:MAG TPA: hypothetical protein [Caudoviricetes sp.]